MSTVASASETLLQAQNDQHKRGCLFYVKRGLLVLVVLIVGLPVLGVAYQQVATESDKRAYPVPGQMVDVGGYSLHLHCIGEGSPTVILEAGGGFTSSSWGWSDSSPAGYDALQNAAELRLLLANAGISPPYILAGHSLGGLYARIFAQQYPDDVAGLVQIDASHPDAWRRLGMREGAAADPQMLAIGPFAARLGLLRLMDVMSADSELSGQLPEHDERAMRAFFATVQFVESARQFDAALPVILEQARAITSLGDVPLVVLTTGNRDEMSPGENRILQDMQRELQSLSTNSIYVAVEAATHVSLVHNRDHAQGTIDAIKQVIEAAQTGEPLAQ